MSAMLSVNNWNLHWDSFVLSCCSRSIWCTSELKVLIHSLGYVTIELRRTTVVIIVVPVLLSFCYQLFYINCDFYTK